ncbi:MAG: fatty acid desaturase [Casimicrobium sp.]
MTTNLSIREIRDAMSDLRTPSIYIYVLDIALCALLGWTAFFGFVIIGTPWRYVCLAISACALYRGLSFIHEFVHQRELSLPRALWHIGVACPLLFPLSLYATVHSVHHSHTAYGSEIDGEYDPIVGHPISWAIKGLLLLPLLPIGLFARFAVLSPVAIASRSWRNRLIPRAVHLTLRQPFVAPAPKWGYREMIEESIASGCCWFLMIHTWFFGWTLLVSWCVLIVCMAFLNHFRMLGSTHLYRLELKGRDTASQISDSMNVIGGGPVTWLICPVGLRYHALHHLVPFVPYHNLAKAHRRLEARLIPTHPYFEAAVENLWRGIRRVLSRVPR